MRLTVIFATLLGFVSGVMPALAHTGHVAEAAGHNHWIGLAAAGVAIAVAVWGMTKAKSKDTVKEDDAEAADEQADDELQEA
jgi:mannose/fructose/N-acetylgalactosamine-specific phosphotransferase system component IIC